MSLTDGNNPVAPSSRKTHGIARPRCMDLHNMHVQKSLANKSHTATVNTVQDRGSEHSIVGGGRVPLRQHHHHQHTHSKRPLLTSPMPTLTTSASSSSYSSRPTLLRRTRSWPSTSHGSSVNNHSFATSAHASARHLESASQSQLNLSSKPLNRLEEDDLDRHPDAYFLSPMEPHDEYWLDWSDEEDETDDEDDEEEVPWNAGIMDFTLFQHERSRAVESQQTLPSQWNNLLSSQRSALQRAVERTQTLPKPIPTSQPRFLRNDDVPGLTPDHSPDLRDFNTLATRRDDVLIHIPPPAADVYRSLSVPEFSTRGFHKQQKLRYEVDGDSKSGETGEEDEQPLYLRALHRQRPSTLTQPALRRPGLRGSRTMSGKVHAWRPPSAYIATVNEDPEAEEQAGHDN